MVLFRGSDIAGLGTHHWQIVVQRQTEVQARIIPTKQSRKAFGFRAHFIITSRPCALLRNVHASTIYPISLELVFGEQNMRTHPDEL